MPAGQPIFSARLRPVRVPAGRRRPSVWVALFLLLTTACLGARPVSEYEVKAAFLLNFARFVEWPAASHPDADSPLVIGIVGDDPFGEALPRIVKGQTAHGRRIEIRHFKEDGDHGACHLLFLSRSVAGRSDRILPSLRGRAILTVSEEENFARQGGVIGFALVDQTVRFDINLKAAAQAELRISSKLLNVARSVVE